jgi:hypothetical protein
MIAAKILVKKIDSFFAVYANKPFEKGEAILLLKGILSKTPSKYSIQISPTDHLEPLTDSPNDEFSSWRFLNHSCEPNSYVDVKQMALVAGRNIRAGEEICFNYNTTEYDMAAPFLCNCGSKECFGEIKGFKHLSEKKSFYSEIG